MNLNRLHWKHAALSLLLSLATLISACGGDTTEPAAEDTLYYVHTDHLGTPQVITDADQKTVWEGRALPFGETDIITHEIAFNVRFPGQYYDQESGLHYNYFRDYDSALGRYIQPDPIGLRGGLNTYGYAYQNPLIYTDPTGEVADKIIVGGAIIIGGGATICQLTGTCPNLGKVCGDIIQEMSKASKKSNKERATDIPSYAQGYQKDPNENCHEYALSILEQQFGTSDPRYKARGPGSDYSKIKKNCERGG